MGRLGWVARNELGFGYCHGWRLGYRLETCRVGCAHHVRKTGGHSPPYKSLGSDAREPYHLEPYHLEPYHLEPCPFTNWF